MSSWRELAAFLTALPPEDFARFSTYSALDLPLAKEEVFAALETYAEENPGATPSILLATSGARAGFSRDSKLARKIGSAALELANTDEERQLAHVSLAQTHFQNRRDERELASFEEHCRAAVELGHVGTYCYERLAALYEYRGEIGDAVEICRRAIEALEGVEDSRSAEKFKKRLGRLSTK